MDQPVRILLADGSEDFSYLVRSCLNRSPRLHVVGHARDPRETLQMFLRLRPEVLILDCTFRGQNRLELLRRLRELDVERRCMIVLMPSRFHDQVLHECRYLGINMILPKPVNLPMLVQQLEQYADSDVRERLWGEASMQWNLIRAGELMMQMHFRRAGIGFQMTRMALALVFRNPGRAVGVTKGIYPEVAQRFDSSVACVEKNIRSAVHSAWQKMSSDEKAEWFGTPTDKAPGNAMFLGLVAELYLRKNGGKNP